MFKRVFLIFSIALCIFSLQALNIDIDVDSFVQASVYVPQNSFAVMDTFEFRFSDSPVSFVPYAGLGYSVRYYGKADSLSRSKALLYGPALRLGLSAVYRKAYASYQLSAGCEGVYSNFPTVIFKEAEVSVVKNYSENMFLKASFGFMWTNEDYSSKIAVGMGKCVN